TPLGRAPSYLLSSRNPKGHQHGVRLLYVSVAKSPSLKRSIRHHTHSAYRAPCSPAVNLWCPSCNDPFLRVFSAIEFVLPVPRRSINAEYHLRSTPACSSRISRVSDVFRVQMATFNSASRSSSRRSSNAARPH
uniref:Uncharacterized protein n=1 Tax=Anopheles dirus TaxID=7168 RepID=A0A182NYX9_9DIPT